jgi:hypothetical protein
MTPIVPAKRGVRRGDPAATPKRQGVRVHDHWRGGKIRLLKREHRCTKKCLRSRGMFGLMFYWCDRYSYAGGE